MVAGRVEQIATARRVQVEEDTGNNNDLLLQTGLEEVEAVRDRAGKTLEVEPQIESRVRHVLDDEAHGAQTLHDVVTLVAEVVLQRLHLGADQAGLQHGHGRLLEGHVGTTVEVRTAGADRLNKLLGAQDPGDTPARETEALGQAVDDQDIVLVDIDNVLGRADGSAVAVASVVVARVELVADQGGVVAANVLDLSQLGVGDNTASGVAGVRGKDDTGTAGNLVGDLVGVDVVAVLLLQGNRDGSELEVNKSMLAAVS